jgi:predicted transcriptional regulator
MTEVKRYDLTYMIIHAVESGNVSPRYQYIYRSLSFDFDFSEFAMAPHITANTICTANIIIEHLSINLSI